MVTISCKDLKDIKISKDDLVSFDGANVEVGFFENAKYSNGTYVASVAFFQDHGTVAIPPRPFFRVAIETNTVKWTNAFKSFVKSNKKEPYKLMGELARSDIIESLTAMNTPPLSPFTIKRKKSSKPLIDTGLLRRSITYKVT